MNKNVNPLLAFAIIMIFGSLLWLKFHFYGKALDVPKATYLKEAADKTLYIRLGEQLYHYNADGQFIQLIDLKKLGITGEMGDFDFFSNGDLLINSDEYQRSLGENLSTYARKENTTTTPPAPGKGLLRCQLEQGQCQLFNGTIPELQGPHFIYVDRQTDEVYLADTTRHEIRKLSPKGELLAELKTGLKFPNQVYLENSKKGRKLWVVDTNHHAMKALKADTKNFGELIETHKTTLDGEWVWPSAFAKTGNSWAVQIADHAMANAKVALFDKYWKQDATLNLPIHADPVSSVFIDNKLIIADGNNYTLYQFDPYGTRLADFARNETTTGIQAVLKANKALDKQYRQWSSWILYFGIGLFALLFAYALKKSREDQEEEQQEAIKNESQADAEKIIRLAKLPPEGEWIEAKTYFKYSKWIGLIIIATLIILSINLYMLMGNKLPIEFLALVTLLPAIIALLMFPITKISQYKIGFFKNNVTVQTDKGQLISAPYQEIKWGCRFFSIGQLFIPIGNPGQSIFPYQALQEKLMPYVLPQNRMGEIDALKLQWKSPDGILKLSAIAMLLGLVLIVTLKRHDIMLFLGLS